MKTKTLIEVAALALLGVAAWRRSQDSFAAPASYITGGILSSDSHHVYPQYDLTMDLSNRWGVFNYGGAPVILN